jgi:hypothetical protein
MVMSGTPGLAWGVAKGSAQWLAMRAPYKDEQRAPGSGTPFAAVRGAVRTPCT